MRDESLRVDGPTIALIVNGKVLDKANVNDVTRLYVVTLENPIYQGEEPFYALVVGRVVWVIPYFTAGLQALLAAVRPVLERVRGVTQVKGAPLPWAWRKKLLGWLPLFPIPRLDCYPVAELPEWARGEGKAPSEEAELFGREA